MICFHMVSFCYHILKGHTYVTFDYAINICLWCLTWTLLHPIPSVGYVLRKVFCEYWVTSFADFQCIIMLDWLAALGYPCDKCICYGQRYILFILLNWIFVKDSQITVYIATGRVVLVIWWTWIKLKEPDRNGCKFVIMKVRSVIIHVKSNATMVIHSVSVVLLCVSCQDLHSHGECVGSIHGLGWS